MRLPDGSRSGTLGEEKESSALAEAVDRISHQLKNPLQAMTVNLEVIRLHARKGEADEAERVAGVVDENIRRVDRRIRMLVSLARRTPEEPATSLDLPELAREAAGAFRLDESEEGPGLEIRLPDAPDADGDGGAGAVRAREGQLLALILAAASRSAEAASSGGTAYLAVEATDSGAVLEVGPAGPWRGAGEREELFAQARRAFGEPHVSGGELAGGGDAGAGGPFRVRFPRP